MDAIESLITELADQGITDTRVHQAFRDIPRTAFVTSSMQERAYENTALPIDCHQTISQPYIVGLMSQTLLQHPHPQKILEIGTGSGYQTAILSRLFPQIWTVERLATLSHQAQERLTKLNLNNVSYLVGDGALGWPDHAPFDGIIVTAAANTLPVALVEQLSQDHGRMVIPLGSQQRVQALTLVTRHRNQIDTTLLEMVQFVPLISDTLPRN